MTKLSTQLKTIRYESQENIYSKIDGVENFKFFVVRRGLVKLFTRFNSSLSLELLYPGLFFANQNEQPYKVELIATEGTEISFLDEEMLDSLIASDRAFVKNFMVMLANHANNSKIDFITIQKTQLFERLATALIADFKHRGLIFNGKLRVKKIFSHEEWALHLHARRESISRAFKYLLDSGAISKSGNFIFLEDKEKLTQLSTLRQKTYN